MRPTIIATVLDEEYRHAQIEIRNHCIAGGREPLPAGSSGELATQKNSQKGVTVAVTSQNLSGDAETWDLNIVFDAHSQDLSDDLAKAAVLSDGSGARYEPVAWEPGLEDITAKVCCASSALLRSLRRSSFGAAATARAVQGCFAGNW